MYTPAQPGQRLGAFLLDLLILDLIRLPLILVIDPVERPQLLLVVNLWVLITYFAAFESSPWRATLGKLLLGIKVSQTNGEIPSFYQALQRISWSICSMGFSFIRALWNPNALAWHDEFTQTCVIEEWWE